MDAFIEMITTFLDVAGSGGAVSISDMLPDIADWYTVVLIAALAMIIGVLQCFLGFKSFKVWCSFIGLLLGAVIGVVFVFSLSLYESAYAELISIFFIVCLGLVGAFVAYRAYLVGVFLFAFSAIFVLCYFPIDAAFDPSMIAIIVGLCAGIAAGVVAVIIQRYAIIAATALSGGMLIAAGLMLLLENANSFVAVFVPIIAALACAGGGFFVQLATTKKVPPPPQPVPVTVVPVQGVVYPPADATQTPATQTPAAQTPATPPAPPAPETPKED